MCYIMLQRVFLKVITKTPDVLKIDITLSQLAHETLLLLHLLAAVAQMICHSSLFQINQQIQANNSSLFKMDRQLQTITTKLSIL